VARNPLGAKSVRIASGGSAVEGRLAAVNRTARESCAERMLNEPQRDLLPPSFGNSCQFLTPA
jgi:hypothetical protein